MNTQLELIRIEHTELQSAYYYSDGSIVSNCGNVWNYGNGTVVIIDDNIECDSATANRLIKGGTK